MTIYKWPVSLDTLRVLKPPKIPSAASDYKFLDDKLTSKKKHGQLQIEEAVNLIGKCGMIPAHRLVYELKIVNAISAPAVASIVVIISVLGIILYKIVTTISAYVREIASYID